MNSETPVRQRDSEIAVRGDALAEGLMLVRASTLKMIRLQLAMERNDRQVAQEAVDDLVALDRMLEDYLADVSAPLMFRRELEAERGAVNREKLTLAAGVVRREPELQPEPEPEPVLSQAEAPPEPAAWGEFDFAVDEPRHRAIKWVALAMVLLAVVAGIAYAVAGAELQAMAGRIGGLS
jgi:hypothetical protein